MTTQPIINQSSSALLQSMMKDFPQSMLLSGPEGIGLSVVAKYIASSIGGITLVVLPEKKEKIDIENGTISVESIRNLRQETRSIQSDKLVIIIDYAERMGARAQNAFLKLLEEPNANIYYILATHDAHKLLPTILSRTQSIVLRPISLAQSNALLDKLNITDDSKRKQVLFMAGGLPASITKLATDNDYFEAKSTIIRDARDLLKATTYDKLKVANRYKDSREQALILLNFASKILQHSITTKPSTELVAQIDKLLICEQLIRANGNVRLALAGLVI